MKVLAVVVLILMIVATMAEVAFMGIDMMRNVPNDGVNPSVTVLSFVAGYDRFEFCQMEEVHGHNQWNCDTGRVELEKLPWNVIRAESFQTFIRWWTKWKELPALIILLLISNFLMRRKS